MTPNSTPTVEKKTLRIKLNFKDTKEEIKKEAPISYLV